jgi:hypothetical protein
MRDWQAGRLRYVGSGMRHFDAPLDEGGELWQKPTRQ